MGVCGLILQAKWADARRERGLVKWQESIAVEAAETHRKTQDLQRSLEAQAASARAARLADLENAYGREPRPTFYDPALSLREALQRSATVCLPINARAAVTVDRFTEFVVTVETRQAMPATAMADFLHAFLPVCSTYVDGVRFSVNGLAVTELKRADLELGGDWMRFPREDTFALLGANTLQRESEDTQQISPRQTGRINDRNTVAALRRAQSKWLKEHNAASDTLNAALKTANQMRAVSGGKSREALQQSLQGIHGARQSLAQVGGFFTSPLDRWRDHLNAESIVGAELDRSLRAFDALFALNSIAAAELFAAASGDLAAVQHFMETLSADFSNWDPEPGREGWFQFKNESTRRRFQQCQDQLRATNQRLAAALETWNQGVHR